MISRIIIIAILYIVPLYSSGGYDHGTSTGRGQIAVDLTWNPFDIIDFGQTYAVFGYGLTERLDFHGYYAHQTNKYDNYYFGVFYQFIDIKYLDLATAIGNRYYTNSKVKDLFFPQLLYTFKISEKFNIGGAFINIKRKNGKGFVNKGIASDITAIITINDLLKLPKFIEDLRFTIGLFNPGLFEPDHGDFLPTYSIDILFRKIGNK